LSFDGPAKWFFLGIIFYLIFIVAIAVTTVFYILLETNLTKKISGFVNILAWIHLFGINVGGPLATILMIFAGLAGSGILTVCTERNTGQQNIEIMNSFITPITISIGILGVGVISGGITYINTYFYGNKV
jgi:hypothetical protein